MTAASLRYLIKEGLKNTWTNRMMSFASIAVLLCCLVLIGSASMMFLNINSIIERIENENVIMVFIDDNTTDEQISEMGEKLKAIPNIELVEFVSKEQAWADQLKTMEDAQARFFTEVSSDIPLPDAYKVTVDDLTKFGDTVKEIKQLDHIYTIRQNTDLAKKLDTISHGISIIAIVIIAVLFAISLFIISNTIKLTVYSRRLEISIMKSVGATNSFVRLPFVVEGCIIGLISGLASLGVVWGVYNLAINQFSDLFKAIQIVPLSFMNYAWQMLGVFVAIGIVSGVGGSLITMRRYLNKEGSEISAI
ncbi:MAG: permease-like cell division protein FtsX [Eubacterium sp.]|nr:permease-like cell division protein FtsX [Eubacterium sp.]